MNDSSSSSEFPWEAVVSKYLFNINFPSLFDSDKFTSVWIAFNAWMKGQFGMKMTDRQLINSTKKYRPIKITFEYLKRSDLDFAEALGSFSDYEIVSEKTSEKFKYDGSFDSLIETLYTLRSNTIHGTDMSGASNPPHMLAFEILYRLFRKHLFPNRLF